MFLDGQTQKNSTSLLDLIKGIRNAYYRLIANRKSTTNRYLLGTNTENINHK